MKSATEFKYKVIYAMYQARFSLEEIRSVVTLSKCESIVFTRIEAIRMKNCTYGVLPAATTRTNPSTSVNYKMFEYKSIVDEYHDDDRTKAEIKKVCKRMLRMFKTEKQYEKEELENLSKIAKNVCIPKFARELRHQRAENYYNNAAQQRPVPAAQYQMPIPYYYGGGYQPINIFDQLRLGMPYTGNPQLAHALCPDNEEKKTDSWPDSKEISNIRKPQEETKEDVDMQHKGEEASEETVAPEDKVCGITITPAKDSLSTVNFYLYRLENKVDSLLTFKELVTPDFTPSYGTTMSNQNCLVKMNITDGFNAEEAKKLMNIDIFKPGIRTKYAIYVSSWVDVCGGVHKVNKWIIPFTVADPNGSHVEWYMVKFNKKHNTYVATDLQLTLE
ncbi:hypothetical protein [Bacteroides acidifaciens]|uniref:hypothetical protein n=1 Tax=Bacteroides acidifaciens TaxID=85831 RepID=UPI00263ACBE4|nr:hypothetical protein [Bacteroides acidifaciens]